MRGPTLNNLSTDFIVSIELTLRVLEQLIWE